jgi:hypothetical protein
VGVGVARRPDGGVVVVQILGAPLRPSGAGSRSPPRHLRTHRAARRAGSGSS